MKEFDELTDKELASLSEDELNRYLAFARMEAGVAKPSEPELVEESDPDVVKRDYYRLRVGSTDLVFKTIEDADVVSRALSSVQCFKSEYDYSVGYDWEYPVSIDPPTVETKKLVVDFPTVKDQLLKLKEAKTHNENERKRYSSELKADEEVTEYIFEAISSAKNRISELNRLIETWSEYVSTCDGNTETAFKFLCKRYGHDQIEKACEYDESQTELALCMGRTESTSI